MLFKAKKDSLHVSILMTLFIAGGFTAYQLESKFLLVLLILVLVWMLDGFNTKYILYDDKIVAKSLFSKKVIQTKDVRFVKKTFVSNMATILNKDRIGIYYSTDDITVSYIYVTPDNQAMFLRELLRNNTHIEVKDKLER